MTDLSHELASRIGQAMKENTPLNIEAGGSKAFLAQSIEGESLSVRDHCGIIDYEPTELVLTARAGTPLVDVDAALAENDQYLPFEPPGFGSAATLGGTIACALSGPARPWAGAARDFVLGVGCVNGRGETLRFGGQVMKNVAGYDVSRLMTGAMGTLGVLLDVSLKVLPRPESTITLVQDSSEPDLRDWLEQWSTRPLPVNGLCLIDGRRYIRLSGAEAAVRAAHATLGGDEQDDDASFWRDLREQALPFFDDSSPLWRISLPPASAALELPGDELTDWGGALRWFKSDAPADVVRDAAERCGGHAVAFRNPPAGVARQHPLTPGLERIHRRLKSAFDPAGILNRGRLYADW